MHRTKLIQLKQDKAWLYASTEFYSANLAYSTCRGFRGQALYTRRENPWFCVVN